MSLFQKIVNICLDKNLNFVVFSYPGKQDFQLVIENPDSDLRTDSEFIFHPFKVSKATPEIRIQSHFCFNSSELNDHNLEEIQTLKSAPKIEISEEIEEISKDQYVNDLGKGIKNMGTAGLDKFIFSRITTHTKSNNLDLSNYLISLRKNHEKTFTYLLQHQSSGIWMGATPETLLSWKNQMISTMSLAGTQKSDLNVLPLWTQKEIEEHEYVTQYIERTFADLKIPIITKARETVHAGPVVHLRTLISSKDQVDFKSALQCANALHPTPAVCGLPLEKAQQYISEIESYDRTYYTGYLGWIHADKELELFVNLRCMQIHPKKLALYVGGGITSKSDVEKEWEETMLKAQTLLNVL